MYKARFSLRRLDTLGAQVELLACSKAHALACTASRGPRNRKSQKLFGWGSNANWAIGQVLPLEHSAPARIELPAAEA